MLEHRTRVFVALMYTLKLTSIYNEDIKPRATVGFSDTFWVRSGSKFRDGVKVLQRARICGVTG